MYRHVVLYVYEKTDLLFFSKNYVYLQHITNVLFFVSWFMLRIAASEDGIVGRVLRLGYMHA